MGSPLGRTRHGVGVINQRVSATCEWRYWKADFSDGSRVSVSIGAKPGGKSLIGVGHEKLVAVDDVDRWKQHWQDELRHFAAVM
jgi:hypothetical protein